MQIYSYKNGKNTIICIGANPSVASGGECDATINNLCSILQNNGYDGFVMLNLYPLIATKLDNLPKESNERIYKKFEKYKMVKSGADITCFFAIKAKFLKFSHKFQNSCSKRHKIVC
nr:DUF1643 domain-containing protein [uncultured Campylobacter sp.]